MTVPEDLIRTLETAGITLADVQRRIADLEHKYNAASEVRIGFASLNGTLVQITFRGKDVVSVVFETPEPTLLSFHRHQLSRHAVGRLPVIFAMPVLLLPRKERDDVLADLQEWYEELAERRGIGWARVFVVGKLLSAIGGQTLKLADRIASIAGKVWGRQKG